MLTKEELESIAGAVRRVSDKRASGAEALTIVQENRGWISDELIKEIAGVTGLTIHELDSIATFYSQILRRPVGRHVVRICDGVSCWIRGYVPIREYISKKLGISFGQTTGNGLFTLLPVSCLGVCETAPSMMIDSTVYGNLTNEKIDRILGQYAGKEVKGSGYE